jgi:hypothetical protein
MESKNDWEKKRPRYERTKTIHVPIEYCAMDFLDFLILDFNGFLLFLSDDATSEGFQLRFVT